MPEGPEALTTNYLINKLGTVFVRTVGMLGA